MKIDINNNNGKFKVGELDISELYGICIFEWTKKVNIFFISKITKIYAILESIQIYHAKNGNKNFYLSKVLKIILFIIINEKLDFLNNNKFFFIIYYFNSYYLWILKLNS